MGLPGAGGGRSQQGRAVSSESAIRMPKPGKSHKTRYKISAFICSHLILNKMPDIPLLEILVHNLGLFGVSVIHSFVTGFSPRGINRDLMLMNILEVPYSKWGKETQWETPSTLHLFRGVVFLVDNDQQLLRTLPFTSQLTFDDLLTWINSQCPYPKTKIHNSCYLYGCFWGLSAMVCVKGIEVGHRRAQEMLTIVIT